MHLLFARTDLVMALSSFESFMRFMALSFLAICLLVFPLPSKKASIASSMSLVSPSFSRISRNWLF